MVNSSVSVLLTAKVFIGRGQGICLVDGFVVCGSCVKLVVAELVAPDRFIQLLLAKVICRESEVLLLP